jgi:hypothetical protein
VFFTTARSAQFYANLVRAAGVQVGHGLFLASFPLDAA